MRVVVYGMGHLGLTHAACMAELGHDVLGVEIDAVKLGRLRAGEVPIYEPGLPDLVSGNVERGRLRFTDSFDEAGAWGPAHFIAVGTPQKKGEFAADTSQVFGVVGAVVPLLRQSSVFFGKSTVPVGTAAELARFTADLARVDVEICWNPEFLREGHAVADTLHPDRVVLGIVPGGTGESMAREIYSDLIARGIPFLVTDLPTAEMVKASANAFLATKISFINAIAEVCAASGADIASVAEAIGYDARIGRQYLDSGVGYGGGCLPKDIRALMARAGELGAEHALSFLREVDLMNMSRRARMVELARSITEGLVGKRIAVLGAAFKPESDDVRDSPALNVAGQLQLQGAYVTVYDPKAIDNARREFPTLGYAESVADACDRADVVMVLTEWNEFIKIDPAELAEVVRQKVVVDGRLCLERARWEAAGWTYRT